MKELSFRKTQLGCYATVAETPLEQLSEPQNGCGQDHTRAFAHIYCYIKTDVSTLMVSYILLDYALSNRTPRTPIRHDLQKVSWSVMVGLVRFVGFKT